MNQPVVVEELFAKHIKTVWSAITEIAQMKQWFFENIPDFKPKTGFKTRFNVNTGKRDFIHLWEIKEVVFQKKIVYKWTYENYVGNAFLVFELFTENNYTKLRVTCSGIESFPQEIPEFRRESCLAGWNYFVKDRLRKYLK